MERTYTVVVTRDPEDGCYVVTVPALDDCSTYGDTLPQVLERAQEAILAYLEGLATLGKDAPPDSERRDALGGERGPSAPDHRGAPILFQTLRVRCFGQPPTAAPRPV